MKQIALLILFSLSAGWVMFAWYANHSLLPVRASVQGELQKSFSVQPGGRLVMDVQPGSINVRTTNSAQVVVDIIRKVERAIDSGGEEILRQHEVAFEQQGNTVIV